MISFTFLLNAETKKENLNKAGLEVLEKWVEKLWKIGNEIQIHFLSMPQDGFITGKEMRQLKKLQKIFDETKRNADKDLIPYGRKTEISASREVRMILKIYYDSSKKWSLRDNQEEEIRKIMARETGRDCKINKSLIIWKFIVIVCAAIIIIVFTVWIFRRL